MEEQKSLRPAIKVQLPSRGVLYDGVLPDGWVELSPMTTREEMLLLSPQKDRLALLDDVIDRCLVTRDLPLADMLVSDKVFLLLSLRSITYGSTYQFTLRCKKCGMELPVSMKVPEGLQLTVLTPEDKEPFEVKLPVSGKTLGLRLLRTKDESAVQSFVRQRVLHGMEEEGDPAYMYRLSRYIVTIDGETSTGVEALTLVENMVGGDSLAMRQAITDNDCSVDLRIKRVCSRCGSPLEELLPLTSEFFRPNPKPISAG